MVGEVADHQELVEPAVEVARTWFSFPRRIVQTEISGKVSLIGAGMKSHPGVTATFFEALSQAGINAEAISTSEIRISVVCRDTDVPSAVRAVHDAFELGAAEGETATVYGGTGR